MKVLFLIGAICTGVLAESSALTNKVLIIGIDGTMPSALAVARTPNLEALKSNGCYSTRVVSHPVTHSAASWSSMFTGVWGDKQQFRRESVHELSEFLQAHRSREQQPEHTRLCALGSNAHGGTGRRREAFV